MIHPNIARSSKYIQWRTFFACVFALSVLGGWNTFQVRAQEAQATTPIEHFIFLMQENHSFDNYFGTYPNVNGIPPNTCIPADPNGGNSADCIEPFHAGSNDVQPDDPDHSTETFRTQFNDGAMNGFVYALNLRHQDGRLSMAYYDDRDLPYYWNIADEYVLFDNFFSSAGGGSFINHLYWIAATHDEPPDGQTLQAYLAGVPTIFDRLQEKGITWKFYVQNYDPGMNYRTLHLYPSDRQSQVIWVPLLSFDRFLDDPELSQHITSLDDYYEDLVNGTLPNVAYIVPSGPSEHPPSSLRSGQRFVRVLLQSLMQSNYWESSAFLWSYDDWGGWYDHVPPLQVDAYGYGFRVPALLVSAYAKQGYVDSTLLDYTSALKFIQENWGLESLSTRDAAANSLVNAFDFSQRPRPAEFVSFERDAGAVRPEPKRFVIYIAYGLGIVLAGVVIAVAILTTRTSPRANSGEEGLTV